MILGIDPGLSGALAVYDHERNEVVEIIDMPVFSIRGKGQLDLYALGRFIDKVAVGVNLAVIEEPGAMPGQGVASMFKFGYACGAVQAAVAANNIPLHLVRPAIWKRLMGLSGDKDDSRRMASMMFPQSAGLWARKKDDGRAEAVLLAVFGKRLTS